MSAKHPETAQIHERFLARLIDGILVWPFLELINNTLGNDTAIGSICAFLLGLIYYGHLTASSWQATIGKRVVGIYVSDEQGRRLSWQNAYARELAVMVPSYSVYVSFLSQQMAVSLFLGLSIIWFGRILVTEERVGVHDMLCHTRVYRGRINASSHA